MDIFIGHINIDIFIGRININMFIGPRCRECVAMAEGIFRSISMRVPYPKYESSFASALPTHGDEVLQLRYYVNVRWFYPEEILLLGYSVMSVGFILKRLFS